MPIDTYTVRDADAGSQIQVEVTFTDDARNEEGPLRSARTDVVTTVNAPPAPAKPRLYASSMQSGSTTELEVQWREPHHWATDPPEVDSYDVRYRVVDAQTWQNGPQDVTVTRATITGLTAGTRYEVQVRSTSNVDGNSVWSRSAKGRTRTAGQAHNGDVRIMDGNAADEGRLEILHAGVWGSVCDDRFSDPGGTPANHPGGTDRPLNVAPALACQMMGYTDGEYASGYGRNLTKSRQNPIWLDDVLCEPGSTHWTGSPATRLDQCNHAGWGLNNCSHREDAGVRCFGSSTAQAPLTSEFQGVPESHDGTEFTFQVAFSEAVTASADDLRDHAFGVTGGTITQISAVDGRQDLWTVTVAPTPNEDISIELEAERACDVAGAICTEDGERLANTVSVEIAAAQPPLVELTARLDATPASHDGETAFTFRLSLSDDIANSDADVRDNAFEVSGGNVTEASRVDGRSDLWEITITPDGTGNVTIVLAANRECGTAGALCTADGRTLTTPVLASIATRRDDDDTGGPEPEASLSARFVDMPAEHNGRKGFGFQLVFSEEVFDGTEQLDKNKAVRNALNITGGSAKGSRRVNASQFDAYWIRVRPSGNGPVTIRLAPPGTCTDSSPTCTPDGRKLSGPISATIEGPPGISITDATVEEAQGAVLEFAVKLSREPSSTVTVDYATSDGTAQAGADYTASSGTLNFAPGETAKTVTVAVLDDSHDEGSETLTLVLSNPSGAYLADAEATGTIENSDLMPQAWLSRFGRTVAEQVLEAVEERIRSAPQAGVQVTVAGQRIGAAQAPETEALDEAEAQARLEDFSTWLRGEAEARESRTGSRPVAPRELLTGSSFALTAGADGIGGGLVSLWGRGALTRFDGREGDLSLSGEVTGALLGADWTRERWTTGLMLSHARGEGSYRGADSGQVSSTVTGLYPYGRYAVTDRVTVWGAAGYGVGTLTLTPDGKPTYEADMDLAMAAAGLRGVVVEAPAEGGPELAVKTDAMAVRTSSEATEDSAGGKLAAAEADVTRLRLGLEGTWRGLEIGTGTLVPRLELGVRHDGGDAETGFGLDLGGGLAWSDPATGVRAEVSGRGLLTHESAGFRERGIAGRLGWDPTPGSDRGPSLTLSQTMGVSAQGGADALLGRTTLAGLAANDNGDELERRRLELKLGYGFGAFGDRFTATPEAGFGMSGAHRDYSLAWRFVRDRRRGDIGSLEFSLETRRRESANDDAPPEHGVGLRLTARF